MIDGEGIPALIQWAGGPVAITRLINAFYDPVEADDLRN
jgi:hemoglobin